MSKSYTPKYVIQEYKRHHLKSVVCSYDHFAIWPKALKEPTDQKLAEYRQKFVESTKPGGVNEHLRGITTGNLRVIDQKTQKVVATYQAPLFEAV